MSSGRGTNTEHPIHQYLNLLTTTTTIMPPRRGPRRSSPPYTEEQRIFMFTCILVDGKSFGQTRTEFYLTFGTTAPHKNYNIQRIVDKIRQRRSTQDLRTANPGRPRSITGDNNIIAAVNTSVANNDGLSTRKRSLVVRQSRSSVRRILKRELTLKPYRAFKCQQLFPSDPAKRLLYISWFEGEILRDPAFPDHVFYTDEAAVHINGTINRFNSYRWCQAGQPPTDHLTPTTGPSPKVNMWAGFSGATGLVGPFIFRSAPLPPPAPQPQPLLGEPLKSVDQWAYRYMLETQVFPALEDLFNNNPHLQPIRPLIFWQQDGAPGHKPYHIRELLETKFGSRIIAKFNARQRTQPTPPRGTGYPPLPPRQALPPGRGRRPGQQPVPSPLPEYPPRSPDLTPCDYSLWGVLKERIFSLGPAPNVPTLIQRIESCSTFSLTYCENTCRAITRRMDCCKRHNGGIFERFL